MKRKTMKHTDMILALGFAMELIYLIVDRWLFKMPEILGECWIIFACVCMIVGLYGKGKEIGKCSDK